MFEEFLKSVCVPDFVSFIFLTSLFAVFYLLFIALLLFFRKVFPLERFSRQIVEVLRWPIFFLLVELTLISFVYLFVQNEKLKGPVLHIFMIFLLATVGFAISGIVKTIFLHFSMKLKKSAETNLSLRTYLTQLLFLYRLTIFLIFVLTLAAILISFPYVRTLGIGILGSAGILGLALGIAARPIFLNIMAGFQIALTKTIKIGDTVFLEGDVCQIESIHLTHVVAKIWDLRRLVVPISYFIDKPFQNWDAENPELLGEVFLFCDYKMDVHLIRKKTAELVNATPLWNQKLAKVDVVDTNEQSMKVRVLVSAKDAANLSNLKSYLREELIAFLQKEYPDMLPCTRYRELIENKT